MSRHFIALLHIAKGTSNKKKLLVEKDAVCVVVVDPRLPPFSPSLADQLIEHYEWK